MNSALRPRHAGESGLLGIRRGCCALIVLLLVVVVAAVVLLVRLTATPNLGAAPVGPADGQSTAAIAGVLVSRDVLPQLTRSGSTGATALVSEHDLTVIAAQNNPDPQTFTHVQVRARGEQLWISADSHLGPLPVVVVAKLTLQFQPGGSITPDIQEMDVGDQAIPGFMRTAIDPRGNAVISFGPLLSSAALRAYGLECVMVLPDRGVELGFHELAATPDAGYCAAHPILAS